MTEQDIFEVRQTDVEIQEIFDQVPKNTKAIEDINDKLPAEASAENQLADKEYVDGKVSAEKTRAEGAEQTLQGNIDTEAQTRQQADQTLDGKIAAEKTRAEGAEGSLQTAINSETTARQQADQTLDGKIAAEKTRAEGAEQALQTAIDIINGKIPAQATTSNQLADKSYVNSSISTATADFKGTYNSLQNLEQVTANANDYAFVIATDAAGNTVYKRYKWVEGTGWSWEYDLNNSSFTAAQWAAIQSGITAALVTKLTDLPTNAELNQRISTAITTALGQYYTKTQIDAALAAINTAIGQKASQADLTAEVTRAQGAEQALQTAIDIINGKIPAQATTSNQLADKSYVNSSISTATADFKGTYNSLQELEQVTANANDYAFVIATDAAGNTVYKRYKWVEGTGWSWEYDLNNSSFTAAQWAAIQSGITAALVTKLSDLPTNAELNQRVQNAIATALTSYYTKTEIDALFQTVNNSLSQKASQTDLTTEENRAKAEEQALQTGKQAVIINLASIAIGSGISSDDTYTAARTVAIPNFILLTGATVKVLFTTPVNSENATLNVNSTGAKTLYILGQQLPAGVIKAQTYAEVVYDGTAWNIVNLFCPGAEYDPAALVVDMGLPSGVKWAARDIDLTKPGGFCDTPFVYEKSFFSWGNIDGHNPISNSAFDYNWGGVNGTEPYYEGQPYGSTPGNTLTGNIAVGEDFDAARANLGSPWRTPANAEFNELFANIIYIDANGDEVDTTQADKRVTVNGVLGLYIQSKLNGARLFFSCSGYGRGRSWDGRGSSGYYWSSTWLSARNARDLNFYSGGVNPQFNNNLYFGFGLRPVQ